MISFSGFKSTLVYMSNYTKRHAFSYFTSTNRTGNIPYRSIKLYMSQLNSAMQKKKKQHSNISTQRL